jgi:hypothetical protein
MIHSTLTNALNYFPLCSIWYKYIYICKFLPCMTTFVQHIQSNESRNKKNILKYLFIARKLCTIEKNKLVFLLQINNRQKREINILSHTRSLIWCQRLSIRIEGPVEDVEGGVLEGVGHYQFLVMYPM